MLHAFTLMAAELDFKVQNNNCIWTHFFHQVYKNFFICIPLAPSKLAYFYKFVNPTINVIKEQGPKDIYSPGLVFSK